MKIKQITLAVVTLLMLITTALPAVAAIEVEGGTYLGYYSKYLWRGADLSAGDAVLQGGMDLSFKGFTLSYWSNFNLDTTELDETDITVDYTTDLSELISLSVGHILYAVEAASDSSEVYVGVGFKTLLDPSLTVYYDYDEFAGDLFVTASVGHSLDLGQGLALNLGGLVSYADNDAYSDLHNYELSVGVDYAVSDQLTLSPSLLYSAPISDDADQVIDDEFVGGLSLNLSF